MEGKNECANEMRRVMNLAKSKQLPKANIVRMAKRAIDHCKSLAKNTESKEMQNELISMYRRFRAKLKVLVSN